MRMSEQIHTELDRNRNLGYAIDGGLRIIGNFL